MNSINQQQQEKNHEDLFNDEAIKKMRELAKKAKTCFFCTAITSGHPIATRPMAVQEVDDNGSFWFLSATDSKQNAEIKNDGYVQLLFQGSSYSDFMSLYGTAVISFDKEKIKELWEPIFKTWFTEGEEDPRISIIQFVPQDGYYWDTKHGEVIAFAKQLAGAVMGKTLDDSIEGRLKV